MVRNDKIGWTRNFVYSYWVGQSQEQVLRSRGLNPPTLLDGNPALLNWNSYETVHPLSLVRYFNFGFNVKILDERGSVDGEGVLVTKQESTLDKNILFINPSINQKIYERGIAIKRGRVMHRSKGDVNGFVLAPLSGNKSEPVLARAFRTYEAYARGIKISTGVRLRPLLVYSPYKDSYSGRYEL